MMNDIGASGEKKCLKILGDWGCCKVMTETDHFLSLLI